MIVVRLVRVRVKHMRGNTSEGMLLEENGEREKKALNDQGLFKGVSVNLELYNIGCLGALG